MHGFDVELYFYKSLERTRTLLGKTITAKSANDYALDIVETALAKIEAGMTRSFQPSLALAA